MGEKITAVQVGQTPDGQPLIVATEARVAALEKRMQEVIDHIEAIEKVIRENVERELMFFSEMAKDDPEYGAYLQDLRERVLSYPMGLGKG